MNDPEPLDSTARDAAGAWQVPALNEATGEFPDDLDPDSLIAAEELELIRRRLLEAPVGTLDDATREAMIAAAMGARVECGKHAGGDDESTS